MYQKRTDIDVVSCVRNGQRAASAIEGTAVRKQYVQYVQETKPARRPATSRAEIIDFRGAAGYTIPEPVGSSYAGNRRARSRRRSRSTSRRAREVSMMKHSAMMLLAGLLLGILMTLAAGMITRASSVSVPPAYKYYDTISVQYGETTDDIISRYMDPLHYETREAFTEELCSINGLETDFAGNPLIHPGIRLIVPYYSEEILN